MFSIIDLAQFINNRIEDCGDTLILGCGEGRFELYLKGLKNCLGIDICDEKLEKCKYKIPVIHADIRKLNGIMYKSFDTITAFDFIEHFNKEEASTLLKEIEECGRKQIILFVPIEEKLQDNIESLQKRQENAIIENKDAGYHLSLWTEQEFKDMGYETYYAPSFHGNFGALIAIKKLI